MSGLHAARKSFDRKSFERGSNFGRASSDFSSRLGDLACRQSGHAHRGNGSAAPVAHTEQDVHLLPPTPKVKDSDFRERQPALARVRSACSQLGRTWPHRRWRAVLGALLGAASLVLLLLWLGRGQARGLGSDATFGGLLRGLGGGAAAGDEGQRWLAERGLALRPRGAPLGVCILTADFWGLKNAGGTATAYHLLAQACSPSAGQQSSLSVGSARLHLPCVCKIRLAAWADSRH